MIVTAVLTGMGLALFTPYWKVGMFIMTVASVFAFALAMSGGTR